MYAPPFLEASRDANDVPALFVRMQIYGPNFISIYHGILNGEQDLRFLKALASWYIACLEYGVGSSQEHFR
jgi:hypothetical protein